ncbi:hypothetical protein PFISCL1PPCAC_12629, partial [Pristionchus fissidentatus]
SLSIISLVGIVLNVIYCLVAIFLIVTVHKTQLHKNCKFLLTIWGLGYLVQFCSHVAMLSLNCILGLPRTKSDPQLLSYFIDVSVGTQLFSEIVEILIATERILSAVRPAQYYMMGLRGGILSMITVAMLAAAFGQGWITEENFNFERFIDSLWNTAPFQVNYVAVSYCGSRYAALHGKATLNARYQIKEAHEIAVTMQRAYIVTFLFKNLFNGQVLLSCYEMDSAYHCVPLLFPLHYSIVEMIYVIGVPGASAFLLVSLMSNHPRLRRKSEALLSKI